MSERLWNSGARVFDGPGLSGHAQTAKLAGSRVVKVGLDASGRRVVGYVELAASADRISNQLNNADPFLLVRSDEMGRQWAIHKDAVSYVVALEEPRLNSLQRHRSFRLTPRSPVIEGKFRQVTIEVIRPATTVVAELFVPYGSTAEAVLNDSQRFISLRNVSFGEGPEVFDYLALARNQSRFWEVLSANGNDETESRPG